MRRVHTSASSRYPVSLDHGVSLARACPDRSALPGARPGGALTIDGVTYTHTGEDCDDTDPDVSADAQEIAGDGVDNDRDGETDEAGAGDDTGDPFGDDIVAEGRDTGSGEGKGGRSQAPVPAPAGVLWALIGLATLRRRAASDPDPTPGGGSR